MTHDPTSRARQLLVDIGLKQPAGDPPEIVAQYERLVAFVAEHLRQVAAEAAKDTLREAAKVALIHCEPFIATTILALLEPPK